MSHELGYDLEEALKREGLCRNDLAALKKPHIQGAPHNITDKVLALFLNACDKDVEETRKVIRLYYEARRNAPEQFSNRDVFSPQTRQCFANQEYFHLPPTPNGYGIICHRLSSPKSSNYFIDEAAKTYYMTIDSCLYKYGPQKGLICLFDMSNVGIMHLTRARLSSVRKFFHYLQDCLPAKLKAIHVMNAVSFFDKVLYIIKPFMKAEILNMLYLHPANENLEKFYEEWVPKSCLPSEYGGDLPSFAELHQEHIKEFEKLNEYFLAEEKQRAEEDHVIEEMEELEIKMAKTEIDEID